MVKGKPPRFGSAHADPHQGAVRFIDGMLSDYLIYDFADNLWIPLCVVSANTLLNERTYRCKKHEGSISVGRNLPIHQFGISAVTMQANNHRLLIFASRVVAIREENEIVMTDFLFALPFERPLLRSDLLRMEKMGKRKKERRPRKAKIGEKIPSDLS